MNKFLTIGTNEIGDIIHPLSNSIINDSIKPSGGLWCTKQDEQDTTFNLWIDYITMKHHQQIFYSKYNGKKTIPAALITLKDDANIFYLDDEEKIQQLKSQFPSNKELFDFEKIANIYDGIYVDVFRFSKEYFKLFQSFCVPSLILFNEKPILHYQSANISIKQLEYEHDYIIEPALYNIDIDNEQKDVKNISNVYNSLRRLFNYYYVQYYETIDKSLIENNANYIYFIYDFINKYFQEIIEKISLDNNIPKQYIYQLLINECINKYPIENNHKKI